MGNFSSEFKEQILKEIEEVGNISLVCRKHNLRTSTVHTWVHKFKNKDKIAASKANRELLKKIKDQEHEILVLKALLKKTYPLWNNEKPLS
jgi:transposase-like protein